ncbi:ATP-binding cassette sub-family G member 1 [Cephus cinctus]|uniref:ATP-binding cassette sub-family G member 1 n=1 Tax=Cephus cinctus TaxID=211228 RepID=A0AAJ7BPT1_CEPCN|nr:ATP-binding cassette sub-family G member 1 [Cephus cinctus]XP_015590804.1 ATP-binding cassette sub-family G member 1 [Cephus cinctus]XP_015590805.1 ATP-binding cassette sub-family G member 1 [Cephus cinctus]XP_015590806.1 ATP-binding cassette sub-family G member 1 [Cephus cinctus]XP_015590808.1 ATP-binding cassette sub-family G member 1 [Cephus cinctus]XP_015590809.1 ATP-binding cassette sub-family G member 1 [Cephus cinctus]XP_015590811.1 ATP-binding cassette sub-family G member 1 [Cephus
MNIEFENLTYRVRDRGHSVRSRQILNDVTGHFRNGELSVIMGHSGAGKTSLLHAVSGYRTLGVTGRLLVNGKLRDNREFRRLRCYITQEDLLQPFLTAREAIRVAAALKLPAIARTTKKAFEQTVEEVLAKIGLTECADVRTESLSGGQRKRLSIALELVNNPPAFFLDEPTSGLDTVSSGQTLRLLRDLAHDGSRAVICTLHQPSASLFKLLDRVYVMAHGRCVYQGKPDSLITFLEEVNRPCPTHYNPADFIIEITEDDSNIELLSNSIENGKRDIDGSETREEKKSIIDSEQICPDFEQFYDYPNSGWHQFTVLLGRMLLQISRNKTGLWVQLFHYLLCGLAVGIVFYNRAQDGSQMFNHLKFCIGVIIFFAYTHLMVPVLVFPTEVKLVKKEHFNRWYDLTPYYAALTVSKLPVQIFLNMIFVSLAYGMTGLPHEGIRFTMFSLIGNAVSLVAEGIGLAIGSVFNITNGCAVGPAAIAPFLGLAIYGFDFAKDIPWYMNALMRLSFIRCGVVGLVLAVFGYGRQRLECPKTEIYCHFDDPKVLLRYLDIDTVSIWSELLSLVGLMCFFRGLCYIGLRYRFSSFT